VAEHLVGEVLGLGGAGMLAGVRGGEGDAMRRDDGRGARRGAS
jgi:hypothetical protein